MGLPSRVALAGAGGFSYYDHVYLPESVKDLTWAHEGRCYRSQIVIRLNGRRRTEAFLHTLDDAGCWRPVQLDDGMQSDGRVETYTRCVESLCGSAETFFTSVFAAQGKRQLSTYRNAEIKTLLADLLGQEEIQELGQKAAEIVRLLKAGLATQRQELAGLDAEDRAPRRGAPKTRRRRRSCVGGRAREDGGTGRPGGRPGAARPRGGRTRAVAGYRCPAGTAWGPNGKPRWQARTQALRALDAQEQRRAAAAGTPRSAGRQPIAAGTTAAAGLGPVPAAMPGGACRGRRGAARRKAPAAGATRADAAQCTHAGVPRAGPSADAVPGGGTSCRAARRRHRTDAGSGRAEGRGTGAPVRIDRRGALRRHGPAGSSGVPICSIFP